MITEDVKVKWNPGKREWNFIRENIDIMSPAEMADFFKIEMGDLTREKSEMGITIDEDGSTSGYEAMRFLNRLERTSSWGLDKDLINVPDFIHRKRHQDVHDILVG